MSSNRSFRSVFGAFILAAVATVPAVAAAAPGGRGCAERNNNQYHKLLECVTVDGVREHQAAFQAIADANGGTRADQTPGYDASVDYVADTMTAAGWTVEVVPFEYPGTDVVLQQLTPTSSDYVSATFTGGGEGDVTGTVVPVDLSLADPATSSSGCEAADFAGVDLSGPADVALIQRGTCNFSFKALNAEAAGAEAVIIFNQGTADRLGPYSNVTLGGPDVVDLPVVTASFDAGVALAAPGSVARVKVESVTRVSHNVIAEKAGKTSGNVVMAGAHLDSVPAGPGINDNGSGSAVLLEVADNLGNHTPQNTLRFAWWGAEELGLIGSTAWVGQRSQEQLDEIALYLNFDMVGSPNHVFMVYDADESTFPAPVPVPDGSIAIEDTFESYYTWAGVPYDDTAFSGRSDYQAFINNGIPSSGLFTGAEVIKTPEQAAIWGGVAGEQFDPCYHLACDTFDNVNLGALDVNADAVAFAVLTYAYSTESVNGVPGKKVPGNFSIPAPAGEEGTFGAPGGGGLDHDHDHEASDG
ncbi:MAG: aminopeptidase [Acidimicrobiaceae bacterium]|nr:aminopeptidase [Acidimicrobiaceae bacterium]